LEDISDLTGSNWLLNLDILESGVDFMEINQMVRISFVVTVFSVIAYSVSSMAINVEAREMHETLKGIWFCDNEDIPIYVFCVNMDIQIDQRFGSLFDTMTRER
jgi:hypothetical protein